jgi:Tfp pilus assembly protein PilF
VDAILEGSVLRSGSRVRISADLVHAASDRHLWVNTYERDVRDVLVLQADIARAIVDEVQVELTPSEKAAFGVQPQLSIAAQDAYLQGRFFWNKRTTVGYERALELFKRAVDIDPRFALAYAGEADVYNLLPGDMPPATAYPIAKSLAVAALELDPTLSEAHTALAFASFIFDRDWKSAEAGYLRAVHFNHGYATAHHWYGEFLAAMGRFDEALTELRVATSIDPLSASIKTSLGSTLYLARRQDEAIAEFHASLALDSGNSSTYLELSQAYIQNHQLNEAQAALDLGLARVGADNVQLREAKAAVDALNGRRSDAVMTLNSLKALGPGIYRSGDLLAYAYLCLGDTDRAYEALAGAEQAGAPGLLWSKVDPMFDAIRDDARFQNLLRRLRLEP